MEATERKLEIRDIRSYSHVPNGQICIRLAPQIDQGFCSLYTQEQLSVTTFALRPYGRPHKYLFDQIGLFFCNLGQVLKCRLAKFYEAASRHQMLLWSTYGGCMADAFFHWYCWLLLLFFGWLKWLRWHWYLVVDCKKVCKFLYSELLSNPDWL